MPAVQIRQWSLLIIVGIIIVLLLSQLTSADQGLQQRRQAVSVFQLDKGKLLTDDNLVDGLSNLALQDPIAKVSWDHAILTVDLLSSFPDRAWTDIGRLVVFSYEEVHNVKQVLIRVYTNERDNRVLLMAVETRKSEWTEKELRELKLLPSIIDSPHTSKVRLSVTPSGKRWIANFAN